MFKIDFRITDNIDWIRHVTAKEFDKEASGIEGFFQMIVGNYTLGYIHEKPLCEGEVGGEWIDSWLSLFLDSAIHLPLTGYVAFRDIESYCLWVEFKAIENGCVLINFGNEYSLLEEGFHEAFITRPIIEFEYDRIDNNKISIQELKNEITKITNTFLVRLKELNPQVIFDDKNVLFYRYPRYVILLPVLSLSVISKDYILRRGII